MIRQIWRSAAGWLAVLSVMAVPALADGVHVAPAGDAASIEGATPIEIAPADPAPLPPCPGDANGDARVDLSDLALVLGEFGWAGELPLKGDVDHDGVVGLSDLALVMNAYGSTCDN